MEWFSQWFDRKVLVTFIDDTTGVSFGTTKMSPADLPESFGIGMILKLGETDWSVVQAEPHRREQFKKSCSLTLRMRKVENVAAESVSFSQLDIIEEFHGNPTIDKDEWIVTTPMNLIIQNPEQAGLPSSEADPEEVYRVACNMSALRESIPIPNDGVYCPICHIANIDISKLRKPCHICGRELLKFGWT